MKTRTNLISGIILLSLSVMTPRILAQEKQTGNGFVPQVGQQGKDVVWVPTPQELVNKMLEIAKVTPDDFVIDLGSGDGRTVITAAKIGAKAIGIEYNPDMVALSKENARKEGVGDKAEFIQADLYETDLSNATVITMFLLPEINLKLRPRLLDLKPGTRLLGREADGAMAAPAEEGAFAARRPAAEDGQKRRRNETRRGVKARGGREAMGAIAGRGSRHNRS